MEYLVIADVGPGAPVELVELLMEAEARRVWEMYLGGVVRRVWYRGDKAGAVLLLECGSQEEAGAAAASLPMVEAGLLEVEVIALGAYDGLAALMRGR
jgi:hypothetical protein